MKNLNFKKMSALLALIISVLLVLCSCGAGPETAKKKASPEKTESVDGTAAGKGGEAKEDASSNVPAEYKSALKKAESYSKTLNMSKEGIFNQLTSEYGEKFSEEAARYAVDNMEADWSENALKKAESYSETMHMSKAGVYEQLTSEYGDKFTEEEAQYAVDNMKADWNENALEKAKSYQETLNMSPENIYDQLISEYGEKFTEEEAQYAIEHLND